MWVSGGDQRLVLSAGLLLSGAGNREGAWSTKRFICLESGRLALPAYDLFHQLKRADFDAQYYFDTNMVVEFFHYIDERDVVIAFSYSGQSQEILYACEVAAKKHAAVIAVTRKMESPLRKLADISLLIPSRETVTRIGAFSSVHMSIMMGNLLYMGAIQEQLEEIKMNLVNTRRLVEHLKVREWDAKL